MNVPVDVLEPGGDVVKAAVIKDSISLIRHGHLFDFYKDAEVSREQPSGCMEGDYHHPVVYLPMEMLQIRLILVSRCKRAEAVVIETVRRQLSIYTAFILLLRPSAFP